MIAGLPSADLLRIAVTMIGGAARPAAPRVTPTAVLAVLVAVAAALAAVVCLFVALWIWARPLVGPAGAPLVVASALGLVALVAALILRRCMRPVAVAPVALPIGAALDDLASVVASHKGPALAAALLAGLIAATRT